MDPQATWNSLLEEWANRNWLNVFELAEALLEWLSNDGFPPDTMGIRNLGADWHRTQALAMCRFALERARDVLNSPHQIPGQVPFTLTCATCNNEGPDAYDEAIDEGWRDIEYFPAGSSENFLGECPICRERDGEA